MQQVVTTRPGGPEVLEVQDAPLVRDPAKVLIDVIAAGLGTADSEMAAGQFYSQPKFPFVSGYDLVGRVTETVPGGPAVGTLVAAMPRRGSWASQVQLTPSVLVALPDDVDPIAVAGLITNGVTAWRMAHQVAHVQAGQTVLVHGASGGVGQLLTQIAVQAGASVVGTSSAANLDVVRKLGATALDYRQPVDVHADVIFDHIGGTHLVDSYRHLNRGGTLVSYGNASTADKPNKGLLPYLVILGRIVLWEASRFVGLGKGRRTRLFNVTPNDRFAADLTAVIAAGLTIPTTAYDYRDAATALTDFTAHKIVGKTVLTF
ncbi:zinc-binding dehydrogenase [Actinokineospora globicatena]|uniref:NADPH:quinone reductase n=1 Tax=Actinokineospora globicatena TaxID=103729 RepID=A0A9W6QU21_9PSEU|nr:zinc-binding dehydrogenase [Actinokineospora globicatena]GLW94780.1 NADPH:quinone reductase [Actinokineospora globicatena]